MDSWLLLSKAGGVGLQGLQEPGGLHTLPGPHPPPPDLPECPASCPAAKPLTRLTGGGTLSFQAPEGLCFLASKTPTVIYKLAISLSTGKTEHLFWLILFVLV